MGEVEHGQLRAGAEVVRDGLEAGLGERQRPHAAGGGRQHVRHGAAQVEQRHGPGVPGPALVAAAARAWAASRTSDCAMGDCGSR